MNKTTRKFPAFTNKIDFRNMSASGEVRFENNLNSLQGNFTLKMLPHDLCLLCSEVL